MLTKLLFTLAVIGAVVWMVRLRRRPVPASPTADPARRRLYRLLAVLVPLTILAVTLAVVWHDWRRDHQVLEVRVIDAGSGRVSRYLVPRNRLGERGFETVDGRRVRLADTERMEVAEAP